MIEWVIDRIGCFFGKHRKDRCTILDQYFDGRYHLRCGVCDYEFIA